MKKGSNYQGIQGAPLTNDSCSFDLEPLSIDEDHESLMKNERNGKKLSINEK